MVHLLELVRRVRTPRGRGSARCGAADKWEGKRAGVVHLLELVRRVRTPEEAAAAINAAQKFALHRARRAQHSALSPELSSWLMRVRRWRLLVYLVELDGDSYLKRLCFRDGRTLSSIDDRHETVVWGVNDDMLECSPVRVACICACT